MLLGLFFVQKIWVVLLKNKPLLAAGFSKTRTGDLHGNIFEQFST